MTDEFFRLYHGDSKGALRWDQFDVLIAHVSANAERGWYIYDTQTAPPSAPLAALELREKLAEISSDVKRRHAEDYCGIAYANDLISPVFIKIFDPDNLGVVCGYSDAPPLPRWLISRCAPRDIHAPSRPPPSGWRAWWARIRQ